MGAHDIGLTALAAVLGLLFGSFATVVAYRVPRKESIASGRSRCPNCGRMITWSENIPLLSYFLQRGRCRHCGEPISIRYPLIEAASGVLFALAAWKFGLTLEGGFYAAFFWTLLVLSVIDLERHLLLNRIMLPLILVSFAWITLISIIDGDFGDFSGTVYYAAVLVVVLGVVTFYPGPTPTDEPLLSEDESGFAVVDFLIGIFVLALWLLLVILGMGTARQTHLAGAIEGAALFSLFLFPAPLLYQRAGTMGMGDVKLAIALGAALGTLGGMPLTGTGLFLSFLIGGVTGMVALALGRSRRDPIPFGPSLALGTVITVLIGQRLLDAYLNSFSG